MKFDMSKFDEIVKREKTKIAELPEHTLDWYTYSNRVELLEEVRALFKEEKKDKINDAPKEVSK